MSPMLATDFARELSAEENAELLDILAFELGLDDKITDFIGSHPVSLSRESICSLLEENYFVCEKSDGIRIMMFVYEEIIYFYDRKNKFYQTDLICKIPLVFMFDGEMYEEQGKHIFAMFDTLIFDKKPRTGCNLTKRLWYAFEFEKIAKKGFVRRKNDSKFKPFDIIGKPMYKSYSFDTVLDEISKLKHDNDGLIFTPVDDPYIICSRSNIYKWKPPHLNTVDFLVVKTSDPGVYSLKCTVSEQQLRIIERTAGTGCTIHFDYFFPEEQDQKFDSEGFIGEFCFNSEKEVIDMDDFMTKMGGWVFYKHRSDKSTPNNIKIVLDTVDSLDSLVSAEDLKKFQVEMRFNYKAREAAIAAAKNVNINT